MERFKISAWIVWFVQSDCKEMQVFLQERHKKVLYD